jgi:hypothetical protein
MLNINDVEDSQGEFKYYNYSDGQEDFKYHN